MNRLHDMEVFVGVVEASSFTAAAEALGVSKSFVSKRVTALEGRLGVRLLHRTTRRQSLTDEGRAFFERCVRILADLNEAEDAVQAAVGEPRGVVRLCAPMSYGVVAVVPAVMAFMARHPGLEVDMTLTDRRVDLVEEGFDLAVRVGVLEDSSLVARRLAPVQRFVCASPAYLARRGIPEHPRALAEHDALVFSHQREGHQWHFSGDEGELSVKVRARLRANNGEALLAGAEAGLGVAMLPGFVVGESLAEGRVVAVLEGWCNWHAAVWALYPHRRHLSVRVRLLVDFLAEALRTESG